MLTEQEIDKIRKSADQAGLGYNTAGIAQRYANDVNRLLKEREEILTQLADAVKHSNHLIEQLKIRQSGDELAMAEASVPNTEEATVGE